MEPITIHWFRYWLLVIGCSEIFQIAGPGTDVTNVTNYSELVPVYWFRRSLLTGNLLVKIFCFLLTNYGVVNWFWFIGSDKKSEPINQLTNDPAYWFGLLVRGCNQYLPLIGFWFIGSRIPYVTKNQLARLFCFWLTN